ncbi:hypothetical protein ANCCEY_08854 [Ancylostoma ceylanicum]|uniref:COX assembly mitochondrial protein n=1 Tax=Ancylostoma ceylanicum TaxID=53326 RepID=A0A0D6LJ88_9BILA|nr:hypothetical protein ANCCEY_08854 [Ancylostoma ceylanicum]
MLPDLSPHLHTRECNFLIELLKRCNEEKTIGEYTCLNSLNLPCYLMEDHCFQAGSSVSARTGMRLDHNPPYSKRIVELRNLPEEYWTPVLKKLKEDGVMPDLTRTDGCRI